MSSSASMREYNLWVAAVVVGKKWWDHWRTKETMLMHTANPEQKKVIPKTWPWLTDRPLLISPSFLLTTNPSSPPSSLLFTEKIQKTSCCFPFVLDCRSPYCLVFFWVQSESQLLATQWLQTVMSRLLEKSINGKWHWVSTGFGYASSFFLDTETLLQPI
jgi:hypothetical protein